MRVHLFALLVMASLPMAAAAVEPAPTAPAAQPNPELKMICRRDKETGSLVKSKKTCHTKSQWAYIDDTNQAFSRDLTDWTRTKSGGN
jgi:predicted transglutaminase-like cysteine proteinase